jgi:hypothetical protein
MTTDNQNWKERNLKDHKSREMFPFSLVYRLAEDNVAEKFKSPPNSRWSLLTVHGMIGIQSTL